MAQVDFYVLAGNSSKEHCACELIANIWRQVDAVCVNTESAADAAGFDNLLWTYQDISFIPHGLFPGVDEPDTSIVIGTQDDALGPAQVMVNLAAGVPHNIEQFARILEIVPVDAGARQQARIRYGYYRDHGHCLGNYSM